MDRLTAMRVFCEVATSGSFSATADKLDMSRAMVTRYVSELEGWLNARLLQRTTRSVTLTDAGEQCLRRSQQMLALMENIEEETRSDDAELRGQLRLTCSTSFAFGHLARVISKFLTMHPLLKIDLHVGDGTVNLVEARIDLAIRISREPDPLLIARPLAVCDSVLVAAPAYVRQAGLPLHPQDLPGHRCLSHANYGRNTWRFMRRDESVQTDIASHFSANDATVLLQAVLAGSGITLLPTYLMADHLDKGDLQIILPEWTAPPMTIYALFPSRRHLSPAVRALLDFLVEEFADQPW
ncbi:LysR family transcriptional regulator [Undibacterium umbellatum]|uniref:LysR family transcriptional regulator n=1 Tax=Undibacterium umbellatum TaxID=2762300 RepID=A0ABR6ZFN0_9BURK|nr:LysR family transcriptional regulator [Undibacterium umbellatum]MBC3910533.1 LysR family transcriptional regulator [Undibacterium umbellatum]